MAGGDVPYGRRISAAAHCGRGDLLGCWRRLWDPDRPSRQRGCLVRGPGEGQLRCRFINTGIAHFVLFLGLYEAQYDNREPVAIAGELRAQFDESDLFALANEDNWWSVVLEQVGHGLL
jgi:hypothetical protein